MQDRMSTRLICSSERIPSIIGCMESRDIGICIYCGSMDNLTREHIIPKSFGGTRTLLRASCDKCARKTSRFETFLLKRPPSGHTGMLYDLRVIAGMPSRKGSTKDVKLRQISENIETNELIEELVDPDTYVGSVMFPIFPEPDCITGAVHPRGLDAEGLEWMQYVSNAEKAKKGYRYGTTFRSREGDFPRLLAKIAYGLAVFELGYERVRHSPLRAVILDNSPDQAKWIGCDPTNTMTADGKSVWAAEIGSYKGRLSAKIKFLPEFADETPEYIVVVDPGSVYKY